MFLLNIIFEFPLHNIVPNNVTPTYDLIGRRVVQRCLRRTAPTGLAECSIHSILATLVFYLSNFANVKIRVFPGELPYFLSLSVASEIPPSTSS